MRVITGIARGRRLLAPEGTDTRPTSDVVKEGVFSALQFEIEGRRILDLFAGSGQLGIEALSRGAKNATFVDMDKSAIDIIKKNIATTGFNTDSTVLNSDSISFLKTSTNIYDIAFLDPPFEMGLLEKSLPLVVKLMSQSGVIVCETPGLSELPQTIGEFEIKKKYKYGKKEVTVYRRREV